MASLTPARSILLSQLLDDVVGTKGMVRIRQDYCRIDDFISQLEQIPMRTTLVVRQKDWICQAVTETICSILIMKTMCK